MKKTKISLYRYMQWILFSFLLSFLSALIFWDQNLILTYRVSATMFSFLFFFYLCKKRPSISFLEKFIWIFSILFCMVWVYAFSQAPRFVFGAGEGDMVNESTSRGIIRLLITGKGFIVLAFFLAVNKFYTTKKKLFILLAIIYFVFIYLQVTRQIIIWSALVAAGYIYLKNKRLSIVIILLVAAFWLLGNTIRLRNNSISASLLMLTEQQVEENEKEENIRITEYKYFFSKYSQNVFANIIGNGMPHKDSSYGRYLDKLHTYNSLFLTDVGYAMMYVVTGMVGLVLYLLLFFKCAFTKVPDPLVYARMFMIYFIFANIAASWYAKPDWQLCMSICVYILMTCGEKRKKLEAF